MSCPRCGFGNARRYVKAGPKARRIRAARKNLYRPGNRVGK